MNSLLVFLTILVCNPATGLNSNGGKLCMEVYQSEPIALADCQRAKNGPQIQQLIAAHGEWSKRGSLPPRAACMEHVER